MKYDDYLLKILKDECPFCDVKKEYVIEKSKYFTVVLARAPYIKDHILIVPNRHLVRLSEITPKEWWDLVLMIEKWMRKMETIHSEVNLLLRDGVAHGVLWKVLCYSDWWEMRKRSKKSERRSENCFEISVDVSGFFISSHSPSIFGWND